jgi:hypothetical protein
VTEADNPDLTHIVFRDTEGMLISGNGKSISEDISIEIEGWNEKECTNNNINRHGRRHGS